MERRIRVMHCIGSLAVGGAEGQLVELIRRLPRDRFEQKLVLLQGGGPFLDQLRDAECEVIELNYKQYYRVTDPRFHWEFARAVMLFVRRLRAWRPDILHAQLFWANILGAVAGRLAHTPVVLTSRLQVSDYRTLQPWKRTLENITNRWTHGVFVNSEAMRRDTLENEIVDPAILKLLYNGVVLDRFDKANPEGPRREFGIEEGDLVVIAVANLHPYKGHDDLVRAVSQLAPRWPRLRVLLPGRDQGMREKLEAMIRELGLAAQVRLIGERKDIPDLMALAAIGVHPSHREGFSNAIVEEMASGLPMVVTNVDGNPEAVRDGVDGFVVPPGQPEALAAAIEKLLADPALRRAMGESSRRRVEDEFSMERMIERFTAWYEELVAKANR